MYEWLGGPGILLPQQATYTETKVPTAGQEAVYVHFAPRSAKYVRLQTQRLGSVPGGFGLQVAEFAVTLMDAVVSRIVPGEMPESFTAWAARCNGSSPKPGRTSRLFVLHVGCATQHIPIKKPRQRAAVIAARTLPKRRRPMR